MHWRPGICPHLAGGAHGSAGETPVLDFGEEMEKGGEGKEWEGKWRGKQRGGMGRPWPTLFATS